MAGTGETRAGSLSLAQRARGRRTCDSCAAAAQATLTRANGEYGAALVPAAQSRRSEGPAIDHLRALECDIVSGGGDSKARKGQFHRALIDRALADEQLTLRRRPDHPSALQHRYSTFHGAGDEI